MPTASINLREASPKEDSVVAKHFYQMWQDIGVPAHFIQSNWLDTTLQFISHARQQLCYKAFVAEVDSTVIGSVSCQLFAGLYPHVLTAEYRQNGYIWCVYVESPYRGQGVAKKLTSMALDYLKSLGCTCAVLHASPLGKPVYSSLGFFESNEMRLNLN